MHEFFKQAGAGISRRRFIQGGVVVSLLLLLAVIFLDFRKTIRRILRRDTDDLNLSEDMIRQFLSEADKEKYWNQFGLAKRALICGQDALAMVGIHTPWYGKYLRYRNEITGRFLLSTDLFQGKYIKGKQVTYLGFHNPYKAPCGNPFSSMRASA